MYRLNIIDLQRCVTAAAILEMESMKILQTEPFAARVCVHKETKIHGRIARIVSNNPCRRTWNINAAAERNFASKCLGGEEAENGRGLHF